MIIGVGIDVAEIDRFDAVAGAHARPGRAALPRRASCCCPAGPPGRASLAARFAAKEALAKALGAPGRAALVGRRGGDARTAGSRGSSSAGRWRRGPSELGVRAFHVSLSHDAGVASAVVIAEG